MTGRTGKEITPEDINVLRDVCQMMYRHYGRQAEDGSLHRRQRELAATMAGEVMTVWEKLPDDGFKIVPR